MADFLGSSGFYTDVAVARRRTDVLYLVGILGDRDFGNAICIYVVVFFLLFGDESANSAGATERFIPESSSGFGLGSDSEH